MYNQEQLGELGLDSDVGEPAPLESYPGGFLVADGDNGGGLLGGDGGGLLGGDGSNGGGLLGGDGGNGGGLLGGDGGNGGGLLVGDGGNGGGLLGDSLGEVPVQDKKEDNTMPEIEDVIEDDNGGLSLPKMEEDSVIF